MALIGHRLWQSRYGARPTVLGQTIALDGVHTTIVGVMPEGFEFPRNAEVWTTLTSIARSRSTPSDARVVSVFGRLAAGRTPEQAQGELESFRMRWGRAAPARLGNLRASAIRSISSFSVA